MMAGTSMDDLRRNYAFFRERGVEIAEILDHGPGSPKALKAGEGQALPVGALFCFWLMYSLPGETWLRLAIWLAMTPRHPST